MLVVPQKSVSIALLGLVAVFCADMARGQNAFAGGAKTVSIAALRVPAKAREHFEKARLAAAAGRVTDYERELAAAFAIDPGFAEALVLRASRKVVARRYEEAIDDVRKAQQLEPGIPWATIVHAEACNGLRRFDEAYALLDGLKSTELGTWQAKYEMTRAVVGRREALAAMQWSKLALDAVPDSALPNALLLRADAFLLARRWPEAVEQFDRYLALDEPLLLRTQVLAVRGRTERLVAETRNSTIAAQ